MANWFSNLFNWRNIIKDEDGIFPVFSRLFSVSPQFNDYTSDLEKLNVAFSSPALLKVITLQCDLFSLGKPYVYQGETELKDDPILRLINSPNPFQQGSQFLWDFMFWNMLGTDYLRCKDRVLSDTSKLYFLDPTKIIFPRELDNWKDKMILTKQSENDLGKIIIEYRYESGETVSFPISELIILTDLSNGVGNWFKGNSRIDALYKIISNTEKTLDAANINIEYTGKFLVGGQADPKDVSKLPLAKDEVTSIESMMKGKNNIKAIKSMIEIKRFVSDLRVLELGKTYLEQYYLIGSMYNIPRDVLEAYNSSTFENQEKARAGHVSYTLEPKGCSLFQALSKRFGYTEAGKEIILSWDHLPFMQALEADRAKVKNMNVLTLNSLLKAGVKFEAANNFLDLGFKPSDYEKPKEPKPNGDAGGGN